MFTKWMIIGAAMLLMLSVQIGCTGQTDPENLQNGAEGETEITGREDEQKILMDEFSALLAEDTKIADIIEFINQKISHLSQENASIMLNELEKAQKNYLPELEEKFYSDDVQNEMNSLNMTGFNMDQINDVNNQELKNLLLEAKDSGYKIETAEGMHFPIINYETYKTFSPSATPDMKDYLDIMAVESAEVPAKDAALVIGWDEILHRAIEQEKFLNQYPDSPKNNDVKELYQKYVLFLLYGLNNTPLFSYESHTMADEAKNVYMNAIDNYNNSELVENIRSFLDVLEKNNYKLTDEVDQFRKSTSEKAGVE